MNKVMKRLCAALLLAVPLAMSGCGGSDQAADSKKIVRVGGTVAVTSSMDPAKEWLGWYAVRYGVGETLFRPDHLAHHTEGQCHVLERREDDGGQGHCLAQTHGGDE